MPRRISLSSPDRTLTLVSYSLTRDEIFDDPTLNVVGEIRNDSEITQDFVKITATFYDETNRVIGTSDTYTDPYTLEPGQSAPFDLGVGDSIPIDEIDHIKYHLGSD
jgi:hypothetical protein